jgi:hypothetical protein
MSPPPIYYFIAVDRNMVGKALEGLPDYHVKNGLPLMKDEFHITLLFRTDFRKYPVLHESLERNIGRVVPFEIHGIYWNDDISAFGVTLADEEHLAHPVNPTHITCARRSADVSPVMSTNMIRDGSARYENVRGGPISGYGKISVFHGKR